MMLGKKCPSCAKKIRRQFSYCPHCGVSFREIQEREDFGMLGREDSGEHIQKELKLPFGMGGLMNSLVKQLEKQMNDLGGETQSGMPKGFQIRIATGDPQMRQIIKNTSGPSKEEAQISEIPEKENGKWKGLPRVEGKSKVRRLADRIIYEIKTPGVRTKNDVVLTKLATGLEIKAYSKDKCYVKFIPLTVEVIEYYVREEKVFVEIKT